MTLEKLAEAVLAEAQKRYTEGGWDVLVECWTVEDIVARWKRDEAECSVPLPRTAEEAIESFQGVVAVWADQQADARNSAF